MRVCSPSSSCLRFPSLLTVPSVSGPSSQGSPTVQAGPLALLGLPFNLNPSVSWPAAVPELVFPRNPAPEDHSAKATVLGQSDG